MSTKRGSLTEILDFLKFTHLFQSVQRVIYIPGIERDENDAEHSFQLALMAWYIIQLKNLPLDISKIIQYALVHDLVEAYAGDTFFYTSDIKLKNSKEEREKDAAEKIKQNFPAFTDLHTLIKLYEERHDKESKFVYALDKVLPVMNIYVDGGRTWRRDGVTYEMIRTKDSKVAQSKEVEIIWKELLPLLEKDVEKLFPHETKNP